MALAGVTSTLINCSRLDRIKYILTAEVTEARRDQILPMLSPCFPLRTSVTSAVRVFYIITDCKQYLL